MQARCRVSLLGDLNVLLVESRGQRPHALLHGVIEAGRQRVYEILELPYCSPQLGDPVIVFA